MKSVSFEQMEAINGGGPASLGCGLLMTAWGGVLAAGLALGPVSAGVSVGVSVAWGAVGVLLCETVGAAESRPQPRR